VCEKGSGELTRTVFDCKKKKRQTDKLPSLDDDGKNREKILSKKKKQRKKRGKGKGPSPSLPRSLAPERLNQTLLCYRPRAAAADFVTKEEG